MDSDNKTTISLSQAEKMACLACKAHERYEGNTDYCHMGDKGDCGLIDMTVGEWDEAGIIKLDPVEEADKIIRIFRKRWIEGGLPMNIEHIVALIKGYEYLRGQVKG